MNDLKIAQSPSATFDELQAIAQAIRELKARQRKFKRVMAQHNKMNRIIGSLVPKSEVVRDY